MNTRNAHVKSHTRVSKNGKQHQVHAHTRQVSMAERVKNGWAKPSARKAKAAFAVGALGSGLWWALSTSFSVGTAFVWAIILVCMGVLSYVLLDKPDRRSARRKLRRTMSAKMQSKLKLWAHHRMVQFRQSEKPKLREKTNTNAAKKTTPASKAKPKSNTRSATFRTAGPRRKTPLKKETHPFDMEYEKKAYEQGNVFDVGAAVKLEREEQEKARAQRPRMP